MKRLHHKILLAYLLPLFGGLIVLNLFLGYSLDRFLLSQKVEELKRLDGAVSNEVNLDAVEAKNREWSDTFCDELGARLGIRVTLIGPDGTVLGDSEVKLADLASVENHATRPEVLAAKAQGFGTTTRLSHTVGVSFLYGVQRLEHDGRLSGYLRLAAPLVEMEGVRRRVHGFLLLGSLLVLLVAALLGYLTSRQVSYPLRQMAEVAKKIGAGDFSVQAPRGARDEVGTLGGVLNQMKADLKAKVEELEAERKEVAAILEGMIEGVVAFDLSEKVLFSNPAAGRSLGFDPATAEGRPFLEVCRMPELYSFAQALLNEGKEVHREMSGFTPGERAWEIVGVPLLGSEGEQRGGLLVLHDVTETRRLERLRQEFVANVSHEMKTPLTAIRGFAETLLGGALEDKENNRVFVERMKAQAERLESLIDDTLSLARIERGEVPLSLSPVDWENLVSRVKESFKVAAGEQSISFQAQVEPDLPKVQGDGKLLEQAIGNLVDNAIKYNRPEGKVLVSVSRSGEKGVRIKVEDTGIGILKDDQPRVFERFYRVDKTRSREMGGTGLGLSIVKHIVERHGGKVGCESEVGKGSRFWFEILS
jgi:two-component system, OmpR family, phosphate regulon sensor histidine kinase PhoR